MTDDKKANSVAPVQAAILPDSHDDVIPTVLLDLGVDFEEAVQNIDVRRGVER